MYIGDKHVIFVYCTVVGLYQQIIIHCVYCYCSSLDSFGNLPLT